MMTKTEGQQAINRSAVWLRGFTKATSVKALTI